ncbi:MAG: hypothetical protein AAF349_05545, partial [Cyanobacteria bacterium P01_A01_bin.68]
MANSENSSSLENSESQQISSSEPLGNNSPLLPQFLVPLGTQSISILQPKIFSPKLIDDFSGTTFENSPFFDEFHPQISAKRENQEVQRNLANVENQRSSTSVTLSNPTELTPSFINTGENLNEHSSFDITTQVNPINIINREHDEIYSTSTEVTESEIKDDFLVDSIQKNTKLKDSSVFKEINIQKKSQSSTSTEINHLVGEEFQNNTFSQSELTTPQISPSDNSNQLQTSLSSEVVDDDSLIEQQPTDIINQSQSSTSTEINH